jgi:hypothetical protein
VFSAATEEEEFIVDVKNNTHRAMNSESFADFCFISEIYCSKIAPKI